MKLTRRSFLHTLAVTPLAVPLLGDEKPKSIEIVGEVGVTTGSFSRHLSVNPAKGKLRLLDLPKLMRDELDMRVLDLMTRNLASMKPAYLDELRNRAEKAGCVLTNLKMNQRGLEMASPDKEKRTAALTEYKRTIDAAERLGCRWVRPLPGAKKPDYDLLAASFRELIDYAEPKGISLLIENFGWLSNDPDAIPAVIRKVDKGLAACPDTGNWTNAVRYAGLAKAYPLAVTSDFKAFMFDAKGEHPRYDLKRCFEVGWKAGFRGPWCLEHFDAKLDRLLAGMVRLRKMIHTWRSQLSRVGE